MIVFLTGVPGAGKTYYAVNKIFEFVRDKKYNYIYTNINQFDYNFSNFVKTFDFDDFYMNIQILYEIYKDKNTTDDDLIEKVKELNYYKSYFVIDECHNYFDTLDKVLVWLFSYHRHIFIDFLLITQNLALVESKYKRFSEYFVRAVPTSLQLFNKKFSYKHFIDSRMSQKSFSGKETIKKDDTIFKLYHSGDNVKAPNIIKKYLLWFIIGSIFVFIAFKVFLNFFSGGSNETVKSHKTSIQRDKISLSSVQSSLPKRSNRQISQEVVDPITDDDNFLFYSMLCLSHICSYQDKHFSLSTLKLLVKQSNSKIIDIKIISSSSVRVNLLLSKSFQNYFKGVENEKSSINPPGIISTFSK